MMPRIRSRLLALTAGLIALVAVRAGASYPEWIVTKAQAETGNTVNAIVTGDFDEDGHPDVVVSFNGTFVNLILTKSDGTFGEPSDPYNGSSLTGLAAVDATSDGHLDIIVSDKSTNRIIVIPGNGDGTFAAPIETQLTNVASRIAVGDFNGDGKVDVALQTSDGPALVIFAGDGLGHFAEISRVTLTGNPYKIVSGDIDGDGKTDVLIARDTTFDFQVFFGRGDGTFDTPVTTGGNDDYSVAIVLADLDGDGDLEILSTQFNTNAFTVVMNLGSKTFASPVGYPTQHPTGLVVVDATGDGIPDVIVAPGDSNALTTYPGNGDGTLGDRVLSLTLRLPLYMVAADFDGDGRLDIVANVTDVIGQRVLAVFRNAPGEVTFGFDRLYPTISVGQPETFTISVSTAPGFLAVPLFPSPTATGSITLRDGATVLATVPLQSGKATIDVPLMTAGVHTLTADYSGDSSYRATVSASVSVNVITDTTTTTLTSSADGQVLPYGQSFDVSANVTSPLAGSLSGDFWLFTDGIRAKYSIPGPPAQWTVPIAESFDPPLPVGSHAFVAVYSGNATQPSSTSNTVTVVVRKARPTIVVFPPNSNVHFGEHPDIQSVFEDEALSAIQPSGGNLRLVEGNTTLVTLPCCSGPFHQHLPLPTISIGTHYLRVTFDGNDRYEPAESSLLKVIVYPSSALLVEAEGGPNFINASPVSTAPSTGYFNIYRRINLGAWTAVATHTRSSWNEPAPQAGVVYSYKMEQLDESFNLMATSNIDVAMMASFTDDPILPSTLVKAQHLAEALAAVNALRAAAGLTPVALTDAGPGQAIRAAHIAAIRTAVNEARSVFGASPAPFSSDLAVNGPIRMQHMQDLRESVR